MRGCWRLPSGWERSWSSRWPYSRSLSSERCVSDLSGGPGYPAPPLARRGIRRQGRAREHPARAEDKDHTRAAIKAFDKLYGTKFPKTVKRITDDQDVLLAFYDYPAEHWIHSRTTNPIESTFATVRLRTKVTKEAGSRSAGLAMVFRVIESAQERWRPVNAPHLVALVRAGARFERGVFVERFEADAA